MKEKKILWIATGISLLLIPTLNKKPSIKYWSLLFLLFGFINHGLDQFLVSRKYITYPIRFAPKLFKIQLIYDYFICPYISIWLCQTTYKSKLRSIIGVSFLFTIPQMLLELWALKKTKLIKYNNNWTLKHTFVAILLVKLLARGILELVKKLSSIKNVHKPTMNESQCQEK